MAGLLLRTGLVSLAIGVLAGCGTMRSYDREAQGLNGHLDGGNVQAALQKHEDDAKSYLSGKSDDTDKDLLYFLEKGQLQRLNNDIPKSVEAWRKADEKVLEWEQEAKLNAGKVLEGVGSVLVNDKVRRYDGQDYEKVALSSMLAVDHAMMGNWDLARLEVKKMHEREAVIAEYRSKEFEKLEEDSKKQGKTAQYSDLKGYPVETLDAPEVIGLKNSYQSAFGHYLAGFVYEALGETSLAAPGYRKAVELQPNVPFLTGALKNLDAAKSRKAKGTDVLIVIEAGLAPARQSRTLPLPVTMGGKLVLTPLSFPVINPVANLKLPSSVVIGDKSVPVANVTSIDAMARRALRDEMPGILLRTTIRAVAKSAMQKTAQDNAGPLGGLIATIASVATEQADERSWRTLPASIALARTHLPAGKHRITINTLSGLQTVEVDIGGKYAIVPIRVLPGHVYLAQPMVPTPIGSGVLLTQESEASVSDKSNRKAQRSAKGSR